MARADELLLGRGWAPSLARDGRRLTLTLVDNEISQRHALLRRAVGAWEIEDLGSKNGILVNGIPRQRYTLLDGDLIEAGRSLVIYRAFESGADATLGRTFGGEAGGSSRSAIFPTWVRDLEHRLSNLAAVAASPISILLLGETGTGKEVVARAVHELSGRPGEFVPINCGGQPETLIESQLFGHRRGAFSGAIEEQEGFVRSAHRGTLFLDEIGDLPLATQATLLRVLQEHKVVPVGATRPVPVDLRVIAATHRDLDVMVAQGTFRRDLLARLVGFELVLPPLRERREDMGILMRTILDELGEKLGADARNATFEREAGRALLSHHYPQNVRELHSALQTAVVLANGKPIALKHLPRPLRAYQSPKGIKPGSPEEQRCAELVEHLRDTYGNVAETARRMGKAHVQIRRMCRRYKIDVNQYRAQKPVP